MSTDNPKPNGTKPHSGQFKPGQSGNPGGRPKIPDEVKRAFESHTMQAVRVLAKAMKDPDPRIRVTAAAHILDRTLGKPAQTLNAKVEGVDLNAAHLEALQTLNGARQASAAILGGEVEEDDMGPAAGNA